MARSDRRALPASCAFAALALAALALAACNAVLGLGDYDKVSCAKDCDAGGTLLPDAAPPDAAPDAAPPPDAGAYVPARAWPRWAMPNPRDLGNLPHAPSYDGGVDAGAIDDLVTHLTWEASATAFVSAAEAAAHCATLAGAKLGGHDDWRLPTRIELVTLVDYTRDAGAAIDPVFASTPNEHFWTQSPIHGTQDFWMVDFFNGAVDGAGRSSAHARCVAGGAR